jgi:hypothetical protein
MREGGAYLLCSSTNNRGGWAVRLISSHLIAQRADALLCIGPRSPRRHTISRRNSAWRPAASTCRRWREHPADPMAHQEPPAKAASRADLMPDGVDGRCRGPRRRCQPHATAGLTQHPINLAGGQRLPGAGASVMSQAVPGRRDQPCVAVRACHSWLGSWCRPESRGGPCAR